MSRWVITTTLTAVPIPLAQLEPPLYPPDGAKRQLAGGSEALVCGGSTDDNPDITKYMGYYRLKVGYQLGEAILSAQGQYNWNTGYGGAELGVSYPITKHARLYPGLQRLRRVAYRL
jgi:hypothetical protein